MSLFDVTPYVPAWSDTGIAGPYWFAAAVDGLLGGVPVAPVAPVPPLVLLVLLPPPLLLLPLLPHPASTIAVLATMAVPSSTTALRLSWIAMTPLLFVTNHIDH